MKDKRIYLKIASVIEFVFAFSMIIYYVVSAKEVNDTVLGNSFMLLIGIASSIIMFRESFKDIEVLRKNKAKIVICSIYMFLDSIVSGILGFIFLRSISNKKNIALPNIKQKNTNTMDYVKSVFVMVLFMVLTFVLPELNFWKKVPVIVTYVIMFLTVIILYYKEIKENFMIFIKNKKVYISYILKTYLSMIGIMIIVSVPIILLKKGTVSPNQVAINNMFNKVPLFTLLLTTLYAPFVEESVFRMSFSKLFKTKWLFIIISGLFFGSLHVIGQLSSVSDLLYIFQYTAMGCFLAKAYIDSNNLFVSWGIHFTQNFLASVLVLLLF